MIASSPKRFTTASRTRSRGAGSAGASNSAELRALVAEVRRVDPEEANTPPGPVHVGEERQRDVEEDRAGVRRLAQRARVRRRVEILVAVLEGDRARAQAVRAEPRRDRVGQRQQRRPQPLRRRRCLGRTCAPGRGSWRPPARRLPGDRPRRGRGAGGPGHGCRAAAPGARGRGPRGPRSSRRRASRAAPPSSARRPRAGAPAAARGTPPPLPPARRRARPASACRRRSSRRASTRRPRPTP